MHICQAIKYEGRAWFKTLSSSSIPKKACIAPSKNQLNREAFYQKKAASLPISNHCVAMSLHFLEGYRKSRSIAFAAHSMENGCSPSVAKTSSVYHNLFNTYRKDAQDTYLSEIRELTANSLDLRFSEEIYFKVPLNKVFEYTQNSLLPGEYVVPLNRHLTALIKEPSGKLTFFDPNHGTVDLDCAEGRSFFEKTLRKNRVHLTEALSFLKITNNTDSTPFSSKKIILEDDKPQITYENGQTRFRRATLTWRKKTYSLLWDSKTNEIYNCDSKKTIRYKCALLIPKTFIDTTVRTIYHLATALFKSLLFPYYLLQGKEKTGKIFYSYADIFRAPFYGVLCESAALYGLFKPYQGRKMYGYFERSLNRQNDQINFHKKYYTARCFKPWNFSMVDDSKNTLKAIRKNILYLEESKKTSLCKRF